MEFALGIGLGLIAGVWLALRAQKAFRSDATAGSELYELAEMVSEYFGRSARPADLQGHESFRKGVKLLRGEQYQSSHLIDYYNGDNQVIACMAMEALARRPTSGDDLFEPIVRTINTVAPWPRFFALRALAAQGKPPLVGRLLLRLDGSWADRFSQQFLGEFVASRVAKGEVPAFGDPQADLPDEQAEFLSRTILGLDEPCRGSLAEDLERWRESRVDTSFLSTFGRVLTGEEGEGPVYDRILERRVLEIERALTAKRPRPALLVGRSGVGKSSALRALARKLDRQGWVVFEASAAEVLASQTYMGELEGRVQKLLAVLAGRRRTLWIIPDFHGLLWAGRHQHSATSILDMVQPALEKGTLLVAGETDPEAHRRLLQARPGLRGLLETFHLEPYGEREARELARAWWSRRDDGAGGAPAEATLSEAALSEAAQFARQYLGDRAAPGNLLQLLELTLDGSADRERREARAVTTQDLLGTVSRLTGLPLSILDEGEALDLDGLARFFAGRVLGQQEAVSCLVERVALVKAGLTDSTRPYGVFFFTGPTGTGKTELAKALAEFLFGSEDRMLRLDMSEFQTEESMSRILGEPGGDQGSRAALVHQIRDQPFSVLLLDEFEKAHPRVWDLFLQLFDDGRLTDRQGNTSDFRHTIIIMTSNLGGDLSGAGGIGFGARSSPDTRGALAAAFRKEFLNRIDRVVTFRPLRRTVMREILLKELRLALERRGLRGRTWAVEWEESALDFLLSRGFTSDLGARPLRRAIERYLLAPLAVTICNHQLPEGDQFLFVRAAGERIEVVFVDPDAEEPRPERRGEARPVELRLLALDARGERDEFDFLKGEVERLASLLESAGWKEQKERALAAMSEPAFWESEDRFRTLGRAEYVDRLEVGMRTAGSLLTRLSGRDETRHRFSPPLLRRLAQQVYLIDAACSGLERDLPAEAFLEIRAREEAGDAGADDDRFTGRIAGMYRSWAARRGMRLQALEERPDGSPAGFRLLLAVSGFAAYAILSDEHGLHVFEAPAPGHGTLRQTVRVRVRPQPDEPAHTKEQLLAQAEAALAGPEPQPLAIVRRYRREPSPLVRDGVREFRTGHLDRILDGDFDLF